MSDVSLIVKVATSETLVVESTSLVMAEFSNANEVSTVALPELSNVAPVTFAIELATAEPSVFIALSGAVELVLSASSDTGGCVDTAGPELHTFVALSDPVSVVLKLSVQIAGSVAVTFAESMSSVVVPRLSKAVTDGGVDTSLPEVISSVAFSKSINADVELSVSLPLAWTRIVTS